MFLIIATPNVIDGRRGSIASLTSQIQIWQGSRRIHSVFLIPFKGDRVMNFVVWTAVTSDGTGWSLYETHPIDRLGWFWDIVTLADSPPVRFPLFLTPFNQVT
jgi:hypothetical protein